MDTDRGNENFIGETPLEQRLAREVSNGLPKRIGLARSREMVRFSVGQANNQKAEFVQQRL